MAVGHAAEIAGITYESEVAEAGLLGPYALSALAVTYDPCPPDLEDGN